VNEEQSRRVESSEDARVLYEFEQPNAGTLGCAFLFGLGILFLFWLVLQRSQSVGWILGAFSWLLLILIIYMGRVRIRIEPRGVWRLPVHWGKVIYLPYSEIDIVSITNQDVDHMQVCRCCLEGRQGQICFSASDTADFNEIVAYIQEQIAERKGYYNDGGSK